MTDPRDPGERPDGPLSGLFYDFTVRVNVGRNHAIAEGHEFVDRAVLEGYDRTLHPWMHGRRPQDLADRVRRWLA